MTYEGKENEGIKGKGRKGFRRFQLMLFTSLKLIKERKWKAYNVFLLFYLLLK